MYRSATARRPVLAIVVATIVALGVSGLPVTGRASATVPGALVSPAAESASQLMVAKDSDGDGVLDRPDAKTAAAAARESDEPVEDLSARTESSTTVTNPDGTRTLKDYGSPVRVQSEDGSWADVDFNLVEQPDGTFAPKVSAAETVIGGGGTTAAASVSFGDGSALGVRWPENLPEPSIDGAVATYKLSETTDLVVVPMEGGFSADIRFNSVPSQADREMVFRLRSDGLKVAETAQGGLQATDADGDAVGRAGSMVAWDARVDEAGDPLELIPLDATLDTVSGAGLNKTQELSLTPPVGLLDDPTTVYPVTIDPDISTFYRTRDTYVRNPIATSYGLSYALAVGAPSNNTANPAEAYLQFDTSPIAGKQIISAELGLHQYYAATCANRQLVANPVNAAWTDSMTWSTRKPGRYGTLDHGYMLTSKGAAGCTQGWTTLNATGMVQAWSGRPRQAPAQTYPNYGFLLDLTDANDNDPSFERRFCSMNPDPGLGYCNSATLMPYLSTTYNTDPTSPVVTSVQPCVVCANPWTVQGTRPTVKATFTDPDGVLSLRLNVRLAASPNTVVVNNFSVPYTTAGITVPAGALTRGTAYEFQVGADDGIAPVAWGGWLPMTTAQNTAPVAPSTIQLSPCVSPCTSPVTVENTQPTFSAATSDIDGDPVTFHLQVRTPSAEENLLELSDDDPPVSDRHSIQVPSDTLDLQTSYEYRLGASDPTETTWTSWVPFQTVDLKPSVPTGVEISPCSTSCGAPVVVDGLRPVFSGTATDADTRLINYRLQVRLPGAGTNLADITGGPTPQGGEGSVRVGAGVLSPGTSYEYRMGAADAHNDNSWGSWTAFSTAGAGGPATVVTGGTDDITSDTTWTRANSPYVINGVVSVAQGATLRIEPGVVVKYGGAVAVRGTIKALGTKAAPITLTSLADDSEGGDSNSDGALTQPAAGDYGAAIYFQDINANAARSRATSVLRNVSLRYGGADGTQSGTLPCLTAGGVIQYGSQTRLEIDHSEFMDSQYNMIKDNNGIDPSIGSLEVKFSRFGPTEGGCQLAGVSAGVFHGNVFEAPSWGNAFAWNTTTQRATFTSNWFMGAINITTLDGPTPRENAQFEQNAFIGGWWGQNDNPQDLSNNWWGRPVASACVGPEGTYPACGQAVDGYFAKVLPAMTQPPKWLNPGLESDPAPAPTLAVEQSYGAGGGEFAQVPYGEQADPVNSANGSFHQTETDVQVPARGMDLMVSRTYNSADASIGSLGKGWSLGYDTSLTFPNPTAVTFKAADGQQLDFIKSGNTYTAAAGVTAELTKPADRYLLRTRAGSTYEFNALGQVLAIKDQHANAVEFTYSGGHLATVSNGARTLTFVYTGDRLTQVTLPDAETITYGYAGTSLISVTDQAGAVTQYGYDTAGRLTSVKDALLKTVMRLAYHPTTGRVSDQWDALDHHTVFEWNPTTSTATMTDPRGNDWVDVYDGAELVQRTDPEGRTWHYTRDQHYQLIRSEDPNSVISTYDYNDAGDLVRFVGPTGVVSTSYDGNHQPLRTVNARGQVTTMSYSPQGDLLEVARPPSGGSSEPTMETFTYDTHGLMETSTDAAGKVTEYGYNASGDPTSVTTPHDRTSTTEYQGGASGMGWASAQVAPGSKRTTFTYDEVGRVKTVVDPLNRTLVTNDYDAAGRLESRTDAKGRETTYTYDDADHIATVTTPDPNAVPLSFDYDANGNQISATDAAGRTLTSSYNAVNEVIAVEGPQGRYETTRTKMGQVDSITAPDASTTFFEYDRGGSLAAADYPGGIVGNEVTYSYDANGNRIGMTDQAGLVGYAYDALDQLVSVQRGDAVTRYDYTTTGRLAKLTYPGAEPTEVNYTYTDDGQLATVAKGATTEATYAYDATTGLLETADVGTGAGAFERTFDFDDAGRLARLRDIKANSSVILDDTYTYDAADNPVSIAHAGAGQDTYTYDVLDRLTGACYSTTTCTGATDYVKWAYDPVGNRTSETRPSGTSTYAYDATTGKLESSTTNAVTTDYTYNALGQLTADGAATYTYDGAGQMATETRGSATTDYTYDGDGRRLTAADGTDTRKFSWDPKTYELLAERDGSDALVSEYLHGLEPLNVTDGNGAVSYYHADRQGSVRALTTTSGSTTQTTEYEPYGVLRSSNPSTPTQPLGFAGQYTDPGALLHLRARQYDPKTGMFNAPDPLGGPGAAANYTYASGNPMVFGDPNGLSSDWLDLDKISLGVKSAVDSVGEFAYDQTVGAVITTVDAVKSAWQICTGVLTKGSCGAAVVIAGVGVASLTPQGKGLSFLKPLIRSGTTRAAAKSESGLSRLLGGRVRDERGSFQIPGQAHDPDQRALIQLAKDAKRRGGLPEDEADILATWADEYGLPGHFPATHPGRPGYGGTVPHINIGPIKHITVR